MIALSKGSVTLRDEARQTSRTCAIDAFELARCPVTRAQFYGIPGDDLPVTEVSWLDAVAYCNRQSAAEGLPEVYVIAGQDVECDWTATGYRLPTEAEWEYACRAGSTDVRYGDLDDIAWYRENSGDVVHPAGAKLPNAWGFHDMIGNVWEWCWDLYDPEVYGEYRVFRGGGAFDPPRACRASCRRKSHPTFRIDDLGFRLARNV